MDLASAADFHRRRPSPAMGGQIPIIGVAIDSACRSADPALPHTTPFALSQFVDAVVNLLIRNLGRNGNRPHDTVTGIASEASGLATAVVVDKVHTPLLSQMQLAKFEANLLHLSSKTSSVALCSPTPERCVACVRRLALQEPVDDRTLHRTVFLDVACKSSHGCSPLLSDTVLRHSFSSEFQGILVKIAPLDLACQGQSDLRTILILEGLQEGIHEVGI